MKCVLRLKETYDLQDLLVKRANVAYDSSNKEHENKLMEVCIIIFLSFLFYFFIYLF